MGHIVFKVVKIIYEILSIEEPTRLDEWDTLAFFTDYLKRPICVNRIMSSSKWC